MITLEFWLHICWILCTRFCKSISSSIQFWLSICKICKVPPRKPKCGSRLPKKGKLVTSKFTVTTWGTIRLFLRQETTHICQDITKNNFLGVGIRCLWLHCEGESEFLECSGNTRQSGMLYSFLACLTAFKLNVLGLCDTDLLVGRLFEWMSCTWCSKGQCGVTTDSWVDARPI